MLSYSDHKNIELLKDAFFFNFRAQLVCVVATKVQLHYLLTNYFI